ncbi:MFS general substrate transporter [Earliella scabrosa]|nr:MFS general substrate transporter [Earliella scabrosa]
MPNSSVEVESSPTRDWGFLPIPRRVRHDPSVPQGFGLGTTVIFGLTAAVVVGNLFYSQPLLIQLADAFGVSHNAVAGIPTVLQAGYATGLLTLCPLGDLVRRRPLVLLLIFLAASLTIGLAVTSNLIVFEVLSFFIGFLTVVPQVLMPLGVDLAPAERRATTLAILYGGLSLGNLFARALSGIVAQFITWRAVFYIAIGMQYVLFCVLYWVLPDYPAKNKEETYWSILRSMAKYAVTEPLLIQAILINIPASACATNYWVTLTFLLGGPAYNYSTLAIGLFGLIGIVGLALSPFIGRVLDKLVPWYGTLIAICSLLAVYTVQTAALGLHIAVVVVVCIAIDIFRQTQYVSITSAVLGLEPKARSRINAVLILSIFIGQVMGTSVGSAVFTQYGWRADGGLNMGWTGLTLIVLLLRGPHVSRYTWIGWEGGAKPWLARQLARIDSVSDAERGTPGVSQTASVRDADDKKGTEETVQTTSEIRELRRSVDNATAV